MNESINTMKRITFILTFILSCLTDIAQNEKYQTEVRINPAETQQTIEGWGVSLCWWADMCGKWNDDKDNKLLDLLTSKDGLN